MLEYLHHQLQVNQLLSTGLVISIIGGLFISLKQAPGRLFSLLKDRLIFTATIYQTDQIFDDFEAWFFAHYKYKYRHVEAVTQDRRSEYPGEYNQRERKVIFKQINGVFIINYKGKSIFIDKNREKLDQTTDLRSMYMNQYHLRSFRGSNIIKELLEECIKFNANRDKDKLRIYSHNEYGDWFISGRIEPKRIENVILPDTIKDKIIEDIDTFESSKDWYNKAGIFYKRGHCYHGAPGNGKTTLCLSISSYMGRDIYCLDLNIISDNSGLKRLFSSLPEKSVLAIEDIDGFFKLREPVKSASKISFSTFLNCIDGAFYKEGLLTIITTNKIEDVDPALKRAGRMDLLTEITNPSLAEVNEYISKFYGESALFLDTYDFDYSMSKIQEICIANKNSPEKLLVEFKQESIYLN